MQKGYLSFLIYHLLLSAAFAQLRVSSPVPRMVFQRTLANKAVITVAGVAPAAATRIEARFVPLAIGQGEVTPWIKLDRLPASSSFLGQATVSAGWYRLDVRAKAGASVLAETHVNRVGVGEVFVIAGQSNVYGGFERAISAINDRVSCVDFRQDSLSEQLLPLQFSHISYGTNLGPSQPAHLWGSLGDSLVRRLNVPVLFLGAALGGTSSSQWQQSAAGLVGSTPGQSVYRRLGAVLLHYVARTGARAVIWHQGESDINTDAETYFTNIKFIIEKSRQQLGGYVLPWLVSRVSYIGGQTNSRVIAAQNRLITDVPSVFAGPATDSITGPQNRPDGVHMQGAGRTRFVVSLNQSLSDSFFQQAIPFTPQNESALITSGYTLPLTRRPGETLAVASVRSNPSEADNQYITQVIRVSDGATVYESAQSVDNPILITLPTDLPDGQYRLRTLSTHPVLTGTLGEPFTVRQSAAPVAPLPILRQPISGGLADSALQRFAYRYESTSHGFYAMVQASTSMEVRLQRLDGGPFTDTNWNPVVSSSQEPDYWDFADFNYLRNYPPIAMATGGVEPGRYRLSVRRQGTTGDGLWFEMRLLDGRTILYYPMEPVAAIPPVLTPSTSPVASTCLSGSFNVAIDVTDGPLNSGNVYSVRLSDGDGSFADETIIGSGSSSPVSVTLPASLPPGDHYRIRIVASDPAVASAPSESLTICGVSGLSADLSVLLQTNSRTPKLGQPVTFTLVLNNAGPGTAKGVMATSRLPDGLDFVGASSPTVQANATEVIVNAGTLTRGTSQPFVFQLKASRAGSFVTAAQITASSQTDPDSQPNSGTGDGQDDAAQVALRTSDGNGSLSVSPNPNQTPLPSVETNQPPVDSTKADLSLDLVSSRLYTESAIPVSLSAIVSNRGGASVTNVDIQVELPDGWSLTNTTGLTLSGQAASGTLAQVPAGSSATLVLSVRGSRTGTLKAQIAGASLTDPDSTPGNGYANGEDDEATLTLRVR
ncbi:hypothetical protein GCM10027341_00470 [Spirosoma knui]